jgi:2-octaprenyl-6-methoxyphenol hydroxylase
MHPIAGQGLNMGLRDVAVLAEVLTDGRRLGLDPGDGTVLNSYEQWRRFDNTLMLAMTDVLNRLFSNDLEPARIARDLGMAAVNKLPPLKKVFMKHAMGLAGDLPRLMRGASL